ncbi:bifunctional methylenetetrahydrofolate dehydrogenase/methenyltetrahydrofolate cyclohydrolase FolD [Caldifermentibacillus hisashii]|jgi:methylenetetrahydrofolate dehydrogenase (NADP+)/methenyltetrahydrofolate cyclohydrolase|uniref:bifunctional methylenetetrahydrofolate dehydrogenase/methenyltetrahydrofolate cyclohydrolase FolD n=1 Tax=Bacillaceae TaxID=186817 RepID=UPI001C1278B6|nr:MULTISPECIES: bifunctional methylenetetrahydrofolate dehydrogenase/methenyltetrahydrofolate cyclohydrolase FolD [Bacillaceae]MCB5933687.1 bifunctional methylenetetrahydrofolate dehydrogenase/methenyltetrahydrofolate cyclohydrolase FolD [Bacillus sp. DFI.2.34]MBU5344012.1 bifunctional methylenetetrahydrofolate dehydrogenase/methenyltetrahydrofolate cyclohydrolase FolD [Caldifermentibacillus hisashii]MCB7069755.1 bifunctional methylenetetrahydrofolate dehydrogenase/methenyltetrahydrofolate cycl
MAGQIIDGKAIAGKKREELKQAVVELKAKGITPGLAVILVGDDPASQTYVRNKQRACKEVGIYSLLLKYEENITEEFLLARIKELNENKEIHGILVQLPLPNQINPKVVIEAIHPDKDVDGFHPLNVGKLLTGEDTFVPCTPLGIIEMLKEIHIDLTGKHAVVIGRSNIVGKPMGQLLLGENATVTYCHSKTVDLPSITRQADVLVSAIGQANRITADYVKEGAVVIDVGMNRNEEGKLCGDVLYDEVKNKASYITPVPGGVGPMTITMLLANTVKAAMKYTAK